MPLNPLDFAIQSPMSICNAVSLLKLCGPAVLAQRSLMLAFVHKRRELLPTFCSILIFATHTHLASLHVMLLNNLSYFTDELDQSLPSAEHTYCHSPRDLGLCPGTRQLTYFLRLFTSNLLALNSVSYNNSKIRPVWRANEVILRRCWFFLTLDGFSIIFSCQNSQF